MPCGHLFWSEELLLDSASFCCYCRGELEAHEEPTGLNPEALLKRKPALALVALIAILDPPRDEAIEAVKVAHDAGITVKMITGEQTSSKVTSLLVCC